MMDHRPNILLITTDQQRFDTVHALGNPYIRTPHLNWLADSGISFTRCYADAPMCIPSRATIMTGRYGYHNALTVNVGNDLPIDPARSLPGLLTQAGYQTRADGKMHFVPNRRNYGFEHMEILEDYYRLMARNPQWGIPADHGMGQNEMEPAISTVDESHSLTHWVVDRSIDFLETRDPSRPFFLWTSFSKPHAPFDPCLNYWLQYQNAEVPDPVYGDWSKNLQDIPPGFLIDTYVLNNSDRFSPQFIRDIRRAYYACITQIDYNLGLLFARLRELSLLENTMILFTSDHGEMLGDHHMGAKGIFLEGSAHVPLIALPPGGNPAFQRGSTCERLTNLSDIYATCLAVAGVGVPEDYPIDGLNILAAARNEVKRSYLLGECGDHYAVIEGYCKYLYCPNGGAELLFNLKNDPYEQKNLAKSSEFAEILPRLRQRLIEHLSKTNPQMVLYGKLETRPVPTVNEMRGLWPGYHSRQKPDEVLH